MNSDQLLAFIAHGLYVGECQDQGKSVQKWTALDGPLKLQYLAQARYTFLRWEEREANNPEVDTSSVDQGNEETSWVMTLPLMEPKDLKDLSIE